MVEPHSHPCLRKFRSLGKSQLASSLDKRLSWAIQIYDSIYIMVIYKWRESSINHLLWFILWSTKMEQWKNTVKWCPPRSACRAQPPRRTCQIALGPRAKIACTDPMLWRSSEKYHDTAEFPFQIPNSFLAVIVFPWPHLSISSTTMTWCVIS